jgi:hypothetical protein
MEVAEASALLRQIVPLKFRTRPPSAFVSPPCLHTPIQQILPLSIKISADYSISAPEIQQNQKNRKSRRNR